MPDETVDCSFYPYGKNNQPSVPEHNGSFSLPKPSDKAEKTATPAPESPKRK